MNRADLIGLLNFARSKTQSTFDALLKLPNAQEVLGWRPGPGRAHLAWQFMHLAATDDRHLNLRILGGQPKHPELVTRFAGGSVVDDIIPTIDEIKSYLAESRADFIAHIEALGESQIPQKPNESAPWTYEEWVRLLSWHEAHHQGQAHITLNLYNGSHAAH